MTQPGSRADDRSDNALRLFIAIACPVLDKVAALLQELQIAALQPDSAIRVVPEQNLHITLKFLGRVTAAESADITAMLDQIAADIKPFTITLTGTGIFNDALWLGIKPCSSLNNLASVIGQGLQPLGFRAETRPYTPHLTVARLEPEARSKYQSRLQQYEDEIWGSLQVRAIHLFKSATLPTGVQYSILHTSIFKTRPKIFCYL